MKKNRTLLVVMTVCMLVLTVIAAMSGIYALSRNELPLGMSYSENANPTEIGVILIILTGLLVLADIGLVVYLTRGKLRALANISSFAGWVCSLLVFIWGTAFGGAEWLIAIAISLPPLITWIISGPSIEVAGDTW